MLWGEGLGLRASRLASIRLPAAQRQLRELSLGARSAAFVPARCPLRFLGFSLGLSLELGILRICRCDLWGLSLKWAFSRIGGIGGDGLSLDWVFLRVVAINCGGLSLEWAFLRMG